MWAVRHHHLAIRYVPQCSTKLLPKPVGSKAKQWCSPRRSLWCSFCCSFLVWKCNIVCQCFHSLLTCKVHFLSFQEHHVTAGTPGTAGVVTLPSGLERSREKRKRKERGYRVKQQNRGWGKEMKEERRRKWGKGEKRKGYARKGKERRERAKNTEKKGWERRGNRKLLT